MHPKQNVFTAADNGKLGGGSHTGRGRGFEGQRAGLRRAGAELGRAGLPPLKHRDVLGWS